jgi:hypothetical protein
MPPVHAKGGNRLFMESEMTDQKKMRLCVGPQYRCDKHDLTAWMEIMIDGEAGHYCLRCWRDWMDLHIGRMTLVHDSQTEGGE